MVVCRGPEQNKAAYVRDLEEKTTLMRRAMKDTAAEALERATTRLKDNDCGGMNNKTKT